MCDVEVVFEFFVYLCVGRDRFCYVDRDSSCGGFIFGVVIIVKKRVRTKKGMGSLPVDIDGSVSRELSRVPVSLRKVYHFDGDVSYDPLVHPGKVMEILSEGKTPKELVKEVGVSLATMKRWVSTYPDFAAAWGIGMELNEAWWDKLGRENLENKDFNNSLYSMFRANLHGWSKKKTEEVIETKRAELRVDLGRLELEDLESLKEVIARAIPADAGPDRE